MVRASHCPPLLHHPEGPTEILELPGGPLLGIEHTANSPQARLTLQPGCLLALYTDGLIETRDADITVGIDRRTQLAHAPGEVAIGADDAVQIVRNMTEPCRPWRRHK